MGEERTFVEREIYIVDMCAVTEIDVGVDIVIIDKIAVRGIEPNPKAHRCRNSATIDVATGRCR